MSQFIELQRSRLEEIDVIREATYKRFRKNPDVIPLEIREKDDVLSLKSSRPIEETIKQKHEIKLFKGKYETLLSQIKESQRQQDLIEISLDRISDPDKNFESFEKLFNHIQQRKTNLVDESLKSMYSMYSSSPLTEIKQLKKTGKLRSKRKYILSQEACNKINFENMFSNEEQFGKFVDLHRFHDFYRQLSKKPELTYIEYLHEFMESNEEKFQNYNNLLIEYFIEFLYKIEPLTTNLQQLSNEIMIKFSSGDLKDGEIFCVPCNKSIKQQAFKSHVEGKKHKKNLNKLEFNEIEFQKFKLKYLIESTILNSKIKDTINNVERRNAMTEREKLMEQQQHYEESDYTNADSDPSDDEDGDGNNDENESDDEDGNDLFKELPLGADGVPMPFWLYKLQGLHHGYNCEICGNIEYKGRITFEKHFNSSKHQQGLKFLGIEEDSMNLFINISKIDEATELWKVIKKQRRSREGEIENSVEVEDKDGNVMSEKDYLQLKRQGMI